MFDKDLINKVCNLTCTKDDVCRDQTAINYDYEYPFEKYYDINVIVGAINKYISKEWDDKTLAGWACIYNHILCGGFHKSLKENFNPLEQYLIDDLSWRLDGLSFFDGNTYFDESEDEIFDIIDSYKNWDHIWQTRNDWKGVYATIGEYDKTNGHQYVLLINDNLKEYIILFSEGHLSNNYKRQNESLKYTTKNKFVKLVEKIKKDYKIISCSEKFYYSDLYDLDE